MADERPERYRLARRDDGRGDRDAAMQRIRVGVTGLAAVFLLTVLAASILSLFGQDTRPHGRAAALLAAEAPREPLAELGVAPGVTAKPVPVPPHRLAPPPAVR